MQSTTVIQNGLNAINSQSSLPDAQSVLTSAEQMAAAKLLSFQQNMIERKMYARRIFWMVALWLAVIILVIISTGVKAFIFSNSLFTLSFKFELSDALLITLVTTTTVNVAGFFLVVVKYLFPNRSDS